MELTQLTGQRNENMKTDQQQLIYFLKISPKKVNFFKNPYFWIEK